MSDTPPLGPTAPRPSRRKRLARLRQRLRTLPIRGDLAALARIHGTDKGYEIGAAHGYVAPYHRELSRIRRRVRTVIEIGIGEYADPYRGGASLRMWKDFFPRARIVGIDIHDKSRQAERRIRIFQGDQTDVAFLRGVIDEVGPPDLVVDDGSHVSAHVIATFRALFPSVREGGLYVVEDLQTAYWAEYGGAHPGSPDVVTSMRHFQALTDDLQAADWKPGARAADPLAAYVARMTFYPKLLFVEKARRR